MTRSLRPEIRNPLLQLPAMQQILDLCARDEPIAPRLLIRLLTELVADMKPRAHHCWHRNKGPMALYWKTAAVYTGHVRRAIRQVMP